MMEHFGKVENTLVNILQGRAFDDHKEWCVLKKSYLITQP